MEKQKQDMVVWNILGMISCILVSYEEYSMEDGCLLGRRYFDGKEKGVCIGRLCRWSL